jgi:hypothetical protein
MPLNAKSTPRMPYRTRLLRPDFFTDSVIGQLEPAAFKTYLGLTTRCDDAGYLRWDATGLAGALLPYQGHPGRAQLLEAHRDELVELGLMVMLDCGCAILPRLFEEHRVKAGEQVFQVRDWHDSSHHYGALRPCGVGINLGESELDWDRDETVIGNRCPACQGRALRSG